MPELKEIVLTEENGYVIKETQKPVEILGGRADLGRVINLNRLIKDDDEKIRAEIEDAIFRVFKLDRVNGYILHAKTQLNEREYMVPFTAVIYQED